MLAALAHHCRMAITRKEKAAKRGHTFIRTWRKHRGLSLEQAIERLGLEIEFPYSVGQLSRVERGEVPYTQDVLEALATIYGCEPGDLIMRDPTSIDALWSIYESLTAPARQQVVEIAKTFKKAG